MIRNSLIITLLFLFSSILGFVCQMFYGKYYGAGSDMDMFYALNSIPSIITGILPVVFSSILIPLYPKYEEKGQLEAFVANVNRKIGVSSLLIILIISVICGAQIKNINSNSLLAITMGAILLVAMFFSIMNGFYISYINYRKKYIQVSLTSLITYSSILFMVIVFHQLLGVIAITFGLLLGAILRFITLKKVMYLTRNNLYIRVNYRKAFSRIVLVFATLLPFSAFPAIAYYWAGSMGNGAISYLGYSHSFEGALSIAGSMGVATVSFPDLAKSLNSASKRKIFETLSEFASTLKAVFFIACIIVTFCCVFVIPISSLLLERGEFMKDDIMKLSFVLPLYFISGGIIAQLNLIRNVFYSLKMIKSLSAISVFITIAFISMAFFVGNRFSYVEVGLTECFLWGMFFFMSLLVLINHVGNFISLSDCIDCVKYIVIPLLIALAMRVFYDSMLESIPLLISISICGIVHVSLSIILLYCTKAKETQIFVRKMLAILHSKK